MVGSISAQIALVAFAFAIFAGLYAGNSPSTVLTRALLVLAGAALIGQVAGYVGKAVLTDYLRARKRQIDTDHIAATESLESADGAEER